MNPEELTFEQFFNSRLKERGVTLKKLAEVTGIARGHLENIAHGSFHSLPSAPYFRGYIITIGKVLDFDGEVWWARIKSEGLVKNSGPMDSLPRNRFVKKPMTKVIWIALAAILALVYLGFQFSKALGKPTVSITFPTDRPYVTSSSTLDIRGITYNADSLTLNGDTITIQADGTWQKTVLLQTGMNTFEIVAKKLLGNESDVTQPVLYTPTATSGTVGANPLNPTTSGTAATGTATGTF